MLPTIVRVEIPLRLARGLARILGQGAPELIADRVRTFEQDQVLVFGTTTFRQFSKFVTMLDEPLDWQNSTVIDEDAVDEVSPG